MGLKNKIDNFKSSVKDAIKIKQTNYKLNFIIDAQKIIIFSLLIIILIILIYQLINNGINLNQNTIYNKGGLNILDKLN